MGLCALEQGPPIVGSNLGVSSGSSPWITCTDGTASKVTATSRAFRRCQNFRGCDYLEDEVDEDAADETIVPYLFD